MSGVFKAIGSISKIASVVALATGNPVLAAAFSANAAIMGVAAGATAKKTPLSGSVSQMTIGANQPGFQMLGQCYCGGKMLYDVGFGPTIDKQPNVFRGTVMDYGSGGPIQGFTGFYYGFNQIPFGGDAVTSSEAVEAIGYFHEIMYVTAQLGQTPEPRALRETTWFMETMPNWGDAYKLSGHAAALWLFKWDSKNGKYSSGLDSFGVVGQWVKAWDPREDSTVAGGSGSQRWASPSDKAAFSAAKPTWTWTRNPGLLALRYALGTWERDETNSAADYVLTFGIGLPLEGVVLADFIELANICDANHWYCDGKIEEDFSRGDNPFWSNLKDILQAGGAEPCFKSGKLGLRIRAPRVSIFTLGLEDLAGGTRVPGVRSFRDRLNTLVPERINPDNKWEYVPDGAVQVTAFVTADKGEKRDTIRYNLVTGADQAAQLIAYQLLEGRKPGQFDLVVMPDHRGIRAGDSGTLSAELASLLGLADTAVLVVKRRFDLASMTVTLTLEPELTADDHSFALSRTGNAPPAANILAPGDVPGAVWGVPPAAPSGSDWSFTAIAIAGDGSSLPALQFAGSDPSGRASSVVLEIFQGEAAPASDADWQLVAVVPIASTPGPITGVGGGLPYMGSIRLANGAGSGPRLILGPVTTGDLLSSGSAPEFVTDETLDTLTDEAGEILTTEG